MPPVYIVDAFSAAPFAGNPAAVVLLNDATAFTDDRRQKIAAEMNLSETAFVEPVRSAIYAASLMLL